MCPSNVLAQVSLGSREHSPSSHASSLVSTTLKRQQRESSIAPVARRYALDGSVSRPHARHDDPGEQLTARGPVVAPQHVHVRLVEQVRTARVLVLRGEPTSTRTAPRVSGLVPVLFRSPFLPQNHEERSLALRRESPRDQEPPADDRRWRFAFRSRDSQLGLVSSFRLLATIESSNFARSRST